MQIIDIKLENVAGIYNGMQLDEIYINFDTGNNINLLCGTNGSGKSTLELAMSPFFNVDIRPKKKGQITIRYRKKNTIIKIKHVATPNDNDGHSVKSYISRMKNNKEIELNENGNVGSFIKAVEEELDITPDKIKLLYLGADIKSIVKMTPTNRKNFISEFTSDADIYLSKIKKVTDDNRALSKLLESCTSAMANLGNETHLLNNAMHIKDYLEEVENDIYTKKVAIDNYNKIIEDFSNYDKSYVHKNQRIENIKSVLGEDYINKTHEEINNEIKDINDEISDIMVQKSQLKIKVENGDKIEELLNEQLDDYLLRKKKHGFNN